jgi:hypothetical protein
LPSLQVQQLVQGGVTAANGANNGQGDTIYMLLTGTDIMQGTSASGFCNSYCGWHTYFTQANGVNVKYGWAGA